MRRLAILVRCEGTIGYSGYLEHWLIYLYLATLAQRVFFTKNQVELSVTAFHKRRFRRFKRSVKKCFFLKLVNGDRMRG